MLLVSVAHFVHELVQGRILALVCVKLVFFGCEHFKRQVVVQIAEILGRKIQSLLTPLALTSTLIMSKREDHSTRIFKKRLNHQ